MLCMLVNCYLIEYNNVMQLGAYFFSELYSLVALLYFTVTNNTISDLTYDMELNNFALPNSNYGCEACL